MKIIHAKSDFIFILYILFGSMWILTSDFLLKIFAPELNSFQFISLVKGLAYVVITGMIFYSIMLKYEKKRIQSQKLEILGLTTAQISHDLNNLFGVIKGWTQLAKYNIDSKYGENEEIVNILEGLEKAQKLIKRLVDFTKETKIEKIELDLNKLIMDFVDKFIKIILSPKIHLNLKLDVNIPQIMASESDIEQILLNLVLNAQYAILHKTPQTDPKEIEISTMKKDKTIIIRVKDTGNGMTPKVMKKLFTPFFTTKSENEGTGLGLSQISKIIKSNNAKITVTSEINTGTTFSIFWLIP